MENINSQLTIIVTTYNSSAMIKSCLDNIDTKVFEVIIVDNASTDNTLALVKQHYPHLQIIHNSQNLGFSRANNIALRNTKKDFALILNVDARISTADITTTLKIMAQHSNIAIAGNVVYNCIIENNQIISSQPCPKNQEQLKGANNDKFFINKFITGAGMFLNMKIMRKIGFFDEGFFLYCEDNEICKRAIKKGYKTAIIKDTRLIHVGGSSSNISASEREKIYWHRFGWSKLYYTQKIYGRIVARIKALRMIGKFATLILKQKIIDHQVAIKDYQALKGCLAFFIGIGAFDKNNQPRG